MSFRQTKTRLKLSKIEMTKMGLKLRSISSKRLRLKLNLKCLPKTTLGCTHIQSPITTTSEAQLKVIVKHSLKRTNISWYDHNIYLIILKADQNTDNTATAHSSVTLGSFGVFLLISFVFCNTVHILMNLPGRIQSIPPITCSPVTILGLTDKPVFLY